MSLCISGETSYDEALALIEHIRTQISARFKNTIQAYLLCDHATLLTSVQARTDSELVATAIFQLFLVYLILNEREDTYIRLFQVS